MAFYSSRRLTLATTTLLPRISVIRCPFGLETNHPRAYSHPLLLFTSPSNTRLIQSDSTNSSMTTAASNGSGSSIGLNSGLSLPITLGRRRNNDASSSSSSTSSSAGSGKKLFSTTTTSAATLPAPATPSPGQPTKNVVVLGGSYGGMHAASVLAARLPPTHRVILIERNSHFNREFLSSVRSKTIAMPKVTSETDLF